MEEKPKPEQSPEEKQPADIPAEERKSRIIDVTDQFLGKSFIITGPPGAKKA